jgi:hypothetical protein
MKTVVFKKLLGILKNSLVMSFILFLLFSCAQIADFLIGPMGRKGDLNYIYETKNPRDVPGLVVWLDAQKDVYDSSCTVPVGHSGLVGCWKDQSGYNNNVGQNISSQRPIFHTNAINGQAALNFSASSAGNIFLEQNFLMKQLNAYANTVITVTLFDYVEYATPRTYLSFWDNGTFFLNHAVVPYGLYAVSKADMGLISNILTDQPRIITSRYSIAESFVQLYNNGQLGNKQNFTGMPQMATYPQLYIGGASLGGYLSDVLNKNHYIAEVIAYDHALTSEQRIGVEKYLAQKYNIDLNIEPNAD